MTILFLGLSTLIFLSCATAIILNKRCGMAALLFSIYHILFFLIPGIIHSHSNIFPFYGLSYSENIQLEGALITFTFTIFVWIGYFLTPGKPQEIRHPPNISTLGSKGFLLAILILLTIQLFSISSIGINNFIVKRSDFDRDAFGSSFALRELFLLLARSASFACLALAIYFRKLIKITIARYLILLSSTTTFLIINYPLALPRFVIFSYLLFFICIYLPATKKLKCIVFLGAMGGVTTIFPFISHITRGEGIFKFDLIKYYGNSGDFDGFQSLLNVVMYVKHAGFSWGHQISGAIFSLVPRSIWSSKPLPTGAIAADHVGYDYVNISSPIVAELFMDFGYFGAVIFAMVTGYFVRTIDNTISGHNRPPTFINLFISATFISYLVIVMRGPLIGAVNHFYIEAIIISAAIFIITSKLSLSGSFKIIRVVR
ncbi:oligosaccharide repeat unit polymerase [Pseudomonas sp. GCM10022186]|uniref:oligosaccharide repeat unit polymerase n=1 Tax=Pseudomonas sp. GCM10022186 TaxID=3252650 RepID=UPI00361B0013